MGLIYSEKTHADASRPNNLFVCSTLVLCLFAIEAFGPEIRALAEEAGWNGHLVFAILRQLMLGASAILFYMGLPRVADTPKNLVPDQITGFDPLLTLRALACFMVVFGHGLPLVFLPTERPLKLSVWPLMGSAWPGVWVFFVLSGYLMGKGFYSGRYGLSKERVWSFYINRCRRIVPMYYTVLFLTAVLSVPGIYLLANLWEIVALVTFSQQNGAGMPIVAALWSVQTEVAFYALVPLLFGGISIAAKRLHPIAIICALLVLGFVYRGAAVQLDSGGWVPRALVPLVANIDLFLIGMLLNWVIALVPKRPSARNLLNYGLWLLLAGYLVLSFAYSRVAVPNPYTQTSMNLIIYIGPTLVTLMTGAAIILFETHVRSGETSGRIGKAIVRNTQFFGAITYAFYSWHEPIYLHLRASLPAIIGLREAFTGLLTALCITMVVAYASYKLVEERFEKRRTLAITPDAKE
ncbi:acyltransferase family protein [Rhizobium sp. A22-96]